jgi:hypothetical protein
VGKRGVSIFIITKRFVVHNASARQDPCSGHFKHFCVYLRTSAAKTITFPSIPAFHNYVMLYHYMDTNLPYIRIFITISASIPSAPPPPPTQLTEILKQLNLNKNHPDGTLLAFLNLNLKLEILPNQTVQYPLTIGL